MHVCIRTHFIPMHNPLKNRVLSSAAALLAFSPVLSAAVLVEDQFLTGGSNYSLGAVVGQGPTSTGFSGDWFQVAGSSATIVAGGLAGPVGMNTAGGSLSIPDGNSRQLRLLANPFTASTVGTYYVSFLFQASAADGQYRSLEFFNGGNADTPDRNLRFGLGGGSGGYGNGESFGLRVGGSATTAVGTGNTAVNHVVLKLELGATAASDTVTVFLNPTNLAGESGNASVSASSLDIAFDRVGIAKFTSGTLGFDEFRIATSFGEATAIPEPSSVAMMVGAGALLCVALRRRRRNAL